MPGRTHHVGPENPSVIERTLNLSVGRSLRHPESEAPPRGRILLRLDRAKPGHDIGRLGRSRPRDPLVLKSLRGDSSVHGRRGWMANLYANVRQVQPIAVTWRGGWAEG